MLIAILGPPAAGKNTLAQHLQTTQGFIRVHINPQTSHPSPAADDTSSAELTFRHSSDLLNHATKQWRRHFVTTDLREKDKLQEFVKRPFVAVVDVSAPVGVRWRRAVGSAQAAGLEPPTLDQFVEADDYLMYGHPPTSASPVATPHPALAASPLAPATVADSLAAVDLNSPAPPPHLPSGSTIPSPAPLTPPIPAPLPEPLAPLLALSSLTLSNPHSTPGPFLASLDLDLLAASLRPAWDTYFMLLATLASLRSNCMKRRVGAVLVRERRVVSTGYNGTPRGVVNCGEGGCSRCNADGDGLGGGGGGMGRGMGEGLEECVCLHAEENALLEAGRERVSGGGVEGAVLYCNTCPCLRCTVKIVQCGVREVVYSLSYSMDTASKQVFEQAGIVVRQIPLPPFPV